MKQNTDHYGGKLLCNRTIYLTAWSKQLGAVDKSVVHYRSAAVCASEAHGAWFNIQAEHKYNLPRDLLRMLKRTWGCWWEGHAPIGGFKLQYLRPAQSSLSVY